MAMRTIAYAAASTLLLVGCAERDTTSAAVHDTAPLRAEALRRLAVEGDDPALERAAHDHPDTLRLALSQSFARLTTVDGRGTTTELALAYRLAGAYAHAWSDSFLVREVGRFERWSAEERLGRVAADSLRLEGIAAVGREGVPAAMALWREALARLAPIDSAGHAAVLASIGGGFYLAGEPDSAIIHLERSRTLARRIGDQRALGTATGILASVRKDAGEIAEAASLYDDASAIRALSGDWRGMAADHNNLGLIARTLGDLDEAKRAFEKALELNERTGRTRPAALNLTNLGDLASLAGEYERADSLYHHALRINRADGDLAETGFVLHDLGLLATRRGQYARALDLLSEALAMHERSGALQDVVRVRHDLAAVQAATGDLQGALGSLDTATREAEALADLPDLVASLALKRADVAVQLGAFEQAEEAFAIAESGYGSIGDEAGRAGAQQGRALLLHLRGDHGAALRALQLTLQTQAGLGDRRTVALTHLLIGQVEMASGDTAASRRTLTRARQALQSIGDPVGEAAVLDALGQLATRGGGTLAAEQLYREGLANIGDAGSVEVRWQLHTHLADALRSRGDLAGAAHALESAVAALEEVAQGLRLEERRVGYLADKWKVYASLAMVERERGRPAEAFAASERLRARQLRDLLARGRVPSSRTATGREQDLRRRITELLREIESSDPSVLAEREARRDTATPDATIEALARAQREYAELLLSIRESDPAYGRLITGEVVPWRSIAARLRSDEVLLQYLVTDSGSTAFVITADDIDAIPLNVDRGALGTLVEFARRTMERPGSSPATPLWRAPLRRLYQQLVEPVDQRGLLEGKTRLVIVPHGELHFVHFGALLDGAPDERFLIERFEVTYAPSATIWVRLAEHPAVPPRARILALAPRTDRLPASREEVLAIRRTHPGRATVLMGAEATKRAFLTRARDHGILHIASFGILNKHNPLFSFVELAGTETDDGRLEVHEVYGMRLTGQLVVLSACQTALGSGSVGDLPPGDDWVGLVQAFLYAGAGGVLASLWPVEDRATARLMRHFYRSLGSGRSEAAALADAQRAMLREDPSLHPFHWSGFVMVGR